MPFADNCRAQLVGGSLQCVEGKRFRLADEVRYIQRRAADYDSRIVTIGQLILFSTKTGDAWLLDPADQLARKAGSRDGLVPVRTKKSGSYATLRRREMDSNHRYPVPPFRSPAFASPPKPLFRARNRWFESRFLQRGVCSRT